MDFMTYKDAKTGTIYIMTAENEKLEEKHPANKGVVRGKLPLGGWIITPDPNNKNRCYCLTVVEVDVGGLLPQFVVRIGFRN